MRKIKIHIFFFVIFINQSVFAQNLIESKSNQRIQRIATDKFKIKFDSLSVIPESFEIVNVKAEDYFIDEINAMLTWKRKPFFDSVTIIYRVFPFIIKEQYNHLKYADIQQNFLSENPITTPINNIGLFNPFINNKDLQTNGTFGRGISFGNNQDAVLNSTLNLQMNGFIGDSIELTAAISDNALPIQPDGNTKDLRDFDRVYLQIKKKEWQISFGDIDLKQNELHFLNFSKRIQGASFNTTNKMGSNSSNNFFFSGAVAKGKFTKNLIIPIEGNQGPYKLQGANNEIYFTVLAGTEKVFIDGNLMQRGDDQDYVIDYNTAEITFTIKHLISKDNRIRIEFEYADRYYLNAQFFISDEIDLNKKFKINISGYNSVDSKNSAIDQVLSDQQKVKLSTIGDSLQQAFISNAVLDTFSLGKILYKKIDTIYNGNLHDSVFVYSSEINNRLYNVSFTFVGAGKGNYHQLQNGINGNVYEWIKPDINNNKNGDYEAVIFLVTPKKQELYSILADYSLSGTTKIVTEFAMSNYNKNLFSSINKEDNHGFAGKIQLNTSTKKFNLLHHNHILYANASFEQVEKKFNPLERIREVEFSRDWSILNPLESVNEKIIDLKIKLSGKTGNEINYSLTNYKRDKIYSGFRQLLSQQGVYGQYKIVSTFNLIQFNNTVQNGNYFRPALQIYKGFKKLDDLQLMVGYSAEKNNIVNNLYDTIAAESFAFERIEASLKSNPHNLNKWELNYFSRLNYLANQKSWKKSDQNSNYSFLASLFKNENSRLKIGSTYRIFEIYEKSLSNPQKDNSLLGNVIYDFIKKNGFIQGGFSYEIGSGQEQKRSYSYLPVPVGQGNYTWIDYNNNSVEELNEFELAIFQDQKKYIKIFTPTNQYIKTNLLQFNYHIDINPASLIKNKVNGYQKLISKSAFSSSLQINKKEIANNNIVFNPFSNSIIDTALISINSLFSNYFSFNKSSSIWGIDINQISSSSKSLLTYGVESRNHQHVFSKARIRLKKKIFFNLGYRNSIDQLNTIGDKFLNKNYRVVQNAVEPSFQLQNMAKWRILLTYTDNLKKNEIDAREVLLSKSLSGEMKVNIFSKTNLNIKINYTHADFRVKNTIENSTVGFFMLDGLSTGRNYLWNIDLNKRIAGNIEMNISYEGRKPGNNSITNIGRASIRAIF